MPTEPKPMPKWKIDPMEAAIQDLQRLKVPITASRIHKRTGPSVTLDEIRHYAAHRFEIPKIEAGLPGRCIDKRSPEEN